MTDLQTVPCQIASLGLDIVLREEKTVSNSPRKYMISSIFFKTLVRFETLHNESWY